MVGANVEEARSCADDEALRNLEPNKDQSENADEEIGLAGLDELFSEKAVESENENLTIKHDKQAFSDEHFNTGDIDRMFQRAVESESNSTAHAHRISRNLFENESTLNSDTKESDNHSQDLFNLFSDDEDDRSVKENKTAKSTKKYSRRQKFQKKNPDVKPKHATVTNERRSTTLDHKDYWKPEVISRINALDLSYLSVIDSDNSDMGSNEDDRCCICLDSHSNPVVLQKCSHKFCKECIQTQFKLKPVCPVCFTTYGIITGIQPHGRMTHCEENTRLPGYEAYNTIVVQYSFQNGIQTNEHPHPGVPYSGTSRVAYLPNSPEGQKVLRLLKESFRRRLTFTVGRSRTTGADNTVTWNDIHHKTSPCGGMESFGYPDPTYLSRVQEELAAVGVTEESLKDSAKLNLSGF